MFHSKVLFCKPRFVFLISLHPLLKPKHSLRELLIHLRCHIGIVRVRMAAVKELHDMEAAAIDVEVDVPLLEIRRDGLPVRPAAH